MRLARFLGGLGRTLIAAGVLLLLFVAYQLWGTGIAAARSQDRLENQFEDRLADAGEATTTSTTSTTALDPTVSVPPSTAPPSTAAPLADAERPPEGEAIGRIQIPKINLDWIFVEGVGVGDLKKGPGHYVDTPFPGQAGNAAIAGHRTTYGAPFNRIDELVEGDEIMVTTLQGSFTYAVQEQLIVSPDQTEVLESFGDNRLTMTSCHPKFSARERIIVVALLQGDALPALPRKTGTTTEKDAPDLDAGLSGEGAPNLPAFIWAAVCAAIWVAAWRVGHWWRKWPAYVLGTPVFLVALFFFFENFSRLLPSNY